MATMWTSFWTGGRMLLHDFKKYMLELRLTFYDFWFAFGFLGFFVVYTLTSSFTAAITLAMVSWVLAIVSFIVYYFELGDVGGYIKDLKKSPSLPLKKRITSWIILFVILLSGYVGAIIFILPGLYFFGNNGFVIGISAVVGMVVGLKAFMIFRKAYH
jgi:hypothetical protein